MPLPTSLSGASCLTLLMMLTACSRNAETAAPLANTGDAAQAVVAEQSVQSKPSAPAPPPAMREAAADSISGAVTDVPPAGQMGSSAAVFEDGQRKFIRTASARFAVKDVYASALGIEDTVAAHGGFVVSNGIVTDVVSTSSHPAGQGKLVELREYAVRGSLVLRVPSARTQEFLRAIVRHISFLDQRNFAARDAQFDLLRQQLETVRSQEAQTELGQAIGNGGKLAQRTDAIASRSEAKAARDAAIVARKMFEDEVAFSTISLEMYQPSRVLQAERIDVASVVRAHQPTFLARLGEGLAGGWAGLQTFILALAAVWPLVLAITLAGFLLWRAGLRRRLSRQRQAADAG